MCVASCSIFVFKIHVIIIIIKNFQSIQFTHILLITFRQVSLISLSQTVGIHCDMNGHYNLVYLYSNGVFFLNVIIGRNLLIVNYENAILRQTATVGVRVLR